MIAFVETHKTNTMPRIFDNIENTLLPAEVVVPHVSEGSPLAALIEEYRLG